MKKVCNIVSTLLLVVMFLAALCFVGPMALGYKELTVLSGSMEPTIPVGSLVCVDTKIDAGELENGDVITYRMGNGTFVTHRLLRKDEENRKLITRGDANDVEDGPVDYGQLYGRVKFHIPYMGFVSSGIRTPKGIFCVTGLLAVIILLNTIPAILSLPDEEKKDGEKKDN